MDSAYRIYAEHFSFCNVFIKFCMQNFKCMLSKSHVIIMHIISIKHSDLMKFDFNYQVLCPLVLYKITDKLQKLIYHLFGKNLIHRYFFLLISDNKIHFSLVLKFNNITTIKFLKLSGHKILKNILI